MFYRSEILPFIGSLTPSRYNELLNGPVQFKRFDVRQVNFSFGGKNSGKPSFLLTSSLIGFAIHHREFCRCSELLFLTCCIFFG